jgi:hypothetical protein
MLIIYSKYKIPSYPGEYNFARSTPSTVLRISVDRFYFLPLLLALAPRVTFRPFLVDCNVLPLTRGKVFPPPILKGDRSVSERFENTRFPIVSAS